MGVEGHLGGPLRVAEGQRAHEGASLVQCLKCNLTWCDAAAAYMAYPAAATNALCAWG